MRHASGRLKVSRRTWLTVLIGLCVPVIAVCGWWGVAWLLREPPLYLSEELSAPASRLTAVTFDPSGTYLAAGSATGDIVVWNRDANTRTALPRFVQQPISALAISPDLFLVAGSADGQIVGAQIGGERTESLPQLPAPVTCIAVRPGRFELAIGLSNGELVFLDEKGLSKSAIREGRGVKGIVYSPDGKLLVTLGTEGKLRWHDAKSRKLLVTKNAHTTEPAGVAISQDGRFAATGDWNGEIRIWSVADRTQVALLAQQDAVSDLGFASETLCTGSWDGRLRFWSDDGWRMLGETDTGSPVNALATHPDGKSVATVSERSEVQIWDVPTE